MSKFLNNVNSKKFIAFAIGCVFFGCGILDQNGWLLLAGAYLGINILDKLIVGIKK